MNRLGAVQGRRSFANNPCRFPESVPDFRDQERDFTPKVLAAAGTWFSRPGIVAKPRQIGRGSVAPTGDYSEKSRPHRHRFAACCRSAAKPFPSLTGGRAFAALITECDAPTHSGRSFPVRSPHARTRAAMKFGLSRCNSFRVAASEGRAQKMAGTPKAKKMAGTLRRRLRKWLAPCEGPLRAADH